jgi:phosphate transport system substrate-binding protein
MRHVLYLTTALAALAGLSAAPALADVAIDGSSTVFPVSEAFAEEFQIETGVRVTVGISGTGGGFRRFCRGETDVTGASRPISASEMELCEAAGIEFIELPIALDALAIIVNPQNDWVECMTIDELKMMWEPEAQDRVNNWTQVRDGFPDQALSLYGPGVDSGTYDYFTAAVVGLEHTSRGDFTATEDDNIIIQGVSSDVGALGFLGLAYVTENIGRVKPVAIERDDGACVMPSVEAAREGSYQPLSRPLFMYVNRAHADENDDVRRYVEFVFDPDFAIELVGEVGYVPLPEEAFEMGQAKFKARSTGTVFKGGSQIGVGIEDLLRIE